MGSVSVTRQREKKLISRFELLFKLKFNNAETKNSALSIPRTFSCALDTFLEKTSCLFLSHLSNLAVRNGFKELLFSTFARYCWNYCHFMEVSLSIIVKCNVNHLRQSDRDRKWKITFKQ